MKAVTAFAHSITGVVSASSCPAYPCDGSIIGSAEPEAFAGWRVSLPEAPVSSNSPSPSVWGVRERFSHEAAGVAANGGNSGRVTGIGSAAMPSRSLW